MNENQAWIKQQADKRRDALIEDFFEAVEERADARRAAEDTEQVEVSFDADKPLHAW